MFLLVRSVAFVTVSACVTVTATRGQDRQLVLVQLGATKVPWNDGDMPHWQLNAQRSGVRCAAEFRHKDIKWMHIPKCGTSFETTLKLVNPHNYRVGRFHAPLHKDVKDRTLKKFTTMLRDPSQRLASAYAWIKRFGNQGEQAKASCENTNRTLQDLLVMGNTPANDTCLASFTGCQTNMLIGNNCMAREQHDDSDIALAKGRLDKFFFVGIFEEWELSMCLLNFKLTGKRFVEQCQLDDHRATNVSIPKNERVATSYDVEGYPQDLSDEEIYRYAQGRFQQELNEYDISTESCKFTFSGEVRA